MVGDGASGSGFAGVAGAGSVNARTLVRKMPRFRS